MRATIIQFSGSFRCIDEQRPHNKDKDTIQKTRKGLGEVPAAYLCPKYKAGAHGSMARYAIRNNTIIALIKLGFLLTLHEPVTAPEIVTRETISEVASIRPDIATNLTNSAMLGVPLQKQREHHDGARD
jgi:hypothetical protein